jgi:hypothetical protein
MLVLAPRLAFATPPSPQDLSTARELFKVGMDAYDRGDATAAVDKLAAAWTLAPTPLIGMGLAHAYEKNNKLVEAREIVLAIHRLEVATGETANSARARDEADKLEPMLARRIGHIHVIVNKAPDGATASIDGSSAPLASLAVDRPVNPGAHTIDLMVSGRVRASQSVTVGEGERKEITLEAPAEPPQAHEDVLAPPVADKTPAPLAPVVVQSSASPLALIGAITLGVGVGAGAIFGALAVFESNTVKTNCVSFACQPADQGHLSNAQIYAGISTTAFVIAGVGATLLVIGLVINHGHTNNARAFLQNEIRF